MKNTTNKFEFTDVSTNSLEVSKAFNQMKIYSSPSGFVIYGPSSSGSSDNDRTTIFEVSSTNGVSIASAPTLDTNPIRRGDVNKNTADGSFRIFAPTYSPTDDAMFLGWEDGKPTWKLPAAIPTGEGDGADFYAPSTGGTSGYVLVAKGSKVRPDWAPLMVNGEHFTPSDTAIIYAPQEPGEEGDFLVSAGSGSPQWRKLAASDFASGGAGGQYLKQGEDGLEWSDLSFTSDDYVTKTGGTSNLPEVITGVKRFDAAVTLTERLTLKYSQGFAVTTNTSSTNGWTMRVLSETTQYGSNCLRFEYTGSGL